jgi:hypothetical protein
VTPISAITTALNLSDDGLFINIAELSLSFLTHGGYVSVAYATGILPALPLFATSTTAILIAAQRMFRHTSVILRQAEVSAGRAVYQCKQSLRHYPSAVQP